MFISVTSAVFQMKLAVSGAFLGYSAISALNPASRDGLSLGRDYNKTALTCTLPTASSHFLCFLLLSCGPACPGRMHRYVFASAIFALSGPVLMRRRQPTSGLLLRSASARKAEHLRRTGARDARRD